MFSVIIKVFSILFILPLTYSQQEPAFKEIKFNSNRACKTSNYTTDFKICLNNSFNFTLKKLLCQFIPNNYKPSFPPGPIVVNGFVDSINENCFEKSFQTFPNPISLNLTILSIRRPVKFDSVALKNVLNLIELDLLISVSWFDYRLCFPKNFNLLEINRQIDEYLRKILWIPDVKIHGYHSIKTSHFLTPFKLFQFYKEHYHKHRKGSFQIIKRVHLQLICNEHHQFSYFFESFSCIIEFQLLDKKDKVCLRLMSYPLVRDDHHIYTGYHISLNKITYNQCTSSFSPSLLTLSSNYSCIQFEYNLIRIPISVTIRLQFINLVLTLMAMMVMAIPIEQYFTRLSLLSLSVLGLGQMIVKFNVNYQVNPNQSKVNNFLFITGLEVIIMCLIAFEIIITRLFFFSSRLKNEVDPSSYRSFYIKAKEYLDLNENSFTFFYKILELISTLIEKLDKYHDVIIFTYRTFIILFFSFTCFQVGYNYLKANRNYQQQIKAKIKIEPKFEDFKSHLENLLPLTKQGYQCEDYNLIKNIYLKRLKLSKRFLLNNPYCLDEELINYLFS